MVFREDQHIKETLNSLIAFLYNKEGRKYISPLAHQTFHLLHIANQPNCLGMRTKYVLHK